MWQIVTQMIQIFKQPNTRRRSICDKILEKGNNSAFDSLNLESQYNVLQTETITHEIGKLKFIQLFIYSSVR